MERVERELFGADGRVSLAHEVFINRVLIIALTIAGVLHAAVLVLVIVLLLSHILE